MAKLSKKQRRSSIGDVGRFLLDVIKPVPTLSALGKRSRNDDPDEYPTPEDVEPELPQTPASPRPSTTHPPACIALQNEDPAEDAIVITALNVVPFCCHADLFTMTRPQLLAVAGTLNAKLPHALQIDTHPSRPDASIRHSIELLVGLRKSLPPPSPPQTAARPRSILDSIEATPRTGIGRRAPPSSPTSPLAERSRLSMSFGMSSLAVLREESDDEQRETPPQRKRRRTDDLLFNYTGPITRAQSRRVAPLLATPTGSSPAASSSQFSADARALRRRSAPLPSTMRSSPTLADSPRRPTRAVTRTVMTSTPKRRAAATAVKSPVRGARPRSLLVEVQNLNAGAARSMESSFASVGVEDVTFGLDGMTMPYVNADEGYSSDMEVTHG